MSILNLTQHSATPSQVAAGVVEPSMAEKATIVAVLTFFDIPATEEVVERAEALAAIAHHHYTMTGGTRFMVGGAGPLMRALRRALKARIPEVEALEAFSRRESVDVKKDDGSVIKTATFVHAGWWPDVD